MDARGRVHSATWLLSRATAAVVQSSDISRAVTGALCDKTDTHAPSATDHNLQGQRGQDEAGQGKRCVHIHMCGWGGGEEGCAG